MNVIALRNMAAAVSAAITKLETDLKTFTVQFMESRAKEGARDYFANEQKEIIAAIGALKAYEAQFNREAWARVKGDQP